MNLYERLKYDECRVSPEHDLIMLDRHELRLLFAVVDAAWEIADPVETPKLYGAIAEISIAKK